MSENKIDLEEIAKQFKDVVKNLADPSDIETLVQDGTLKENGSWFVIESLDLLPETVSKKIKTIKSTKEGILLKFENSKHFKKLANKF